MASAWKMEVRPRTTGEVLDEAWRLYLNYPRLLLTLSGLFTVPWALALVFVLTRPAAAAPVAALIPAAVAALLLPLTGLGSGACQEAFRRLAEGKPATVGASLAAACRKGLDHLTARGLIGGGVCLGLLCLWPRGMNPGLVFLAGLCFAALAAVMGIGTAAVHPILAAGDAHVFRALVAAGREVQRSAGKAVVVTLGRFLMLAFVALNLHAFLLVGLWAADNLAGFGMPVVDLLVSVFNPVYDVLLGLAAWVLLAPYGEAANFLLHADAQARFEGLDLWYRVRRLFPALHKARAGLILLTLGATLAPAAGVRAAPSLDTVRGIRQQVAAVKEEMDKAHPYPGGHVWLPRLQRLADRLDPDGTTTRGRYRWFRQAVADLPHRRQQDAVAVLSNLDRQLALVEQSLAEATPGEQPAALSREAIKALVPKEEGPGRYQRPPRADDEKQEPKKTRAPAGDSGDEVGPRRVQRRGPGLVVASPAGGLATVGWLLLAGLLAAVLVIGTIRFLQDRRKARALAQAPKIERAQLPAESLLEQPTKQTAASLWRQADRLAEDGNLPEAIRTLHLAVLALLHWAGLIRYERTRTNGEYENQLHARPELLPPFRRLTGLVECKWYGEQACQAGDYQACRGMAEVIQGAVNQLIS